jgi:D-hexose-6-phosphate mutarotase
MHELDALRMRFFDNPACAEFLSFSETAPNFISIKVDTAFSTATIALQGAHVMGWQPLGQKPVIWLSPDAKLAPGKSIRGGVPLCWPWFGPHPTEAGYPGHGFARTIPWTLNDARKLPDGRVRLEFEPLLDATTRAQWPHDSKVKATITIGQELVIGLATTNTGDTPFPLGQALHTYFAVGDISQTQIAGLGGCAYIDKLAGDKRKKQKGMVTFAGEMDRVYLDTPGCCGIIDPLWKRTILITSTGSRSTVVWNPGAAKAAKMGDFGKIRGKQGEDTMVCVETANAAADVITLAPGATHRMTAQYRVIPA